MPHAFEQVSLKPARYHIGGGQYRDLTASDIQEYIDGTNELLAAGYEPPVIAEHAPPGSDEGAPKARTARDERAAAVKHGAGWMKGIKGSDGAAAFKLDVHDEEVAKKMRDGSIKFTSPELRESWTDGAGRTFKKIISHVALTHKPRNPDQGPFREVAGVAQFSLEDSTQMAVDDEAPEVEKPADEEKPAETPEEKPEDTNPDAPEEKDESADDAKRAQRIEAIIGHLEKLGISMPEDTCEAEEQILLDRLLTALMTANAASDKADAEETEAADDEPAEMPEIAEERPAAVQQYSLAEVESDKFENKLLGRIIKQEAAGVRAKLERMVGETKITPAVRDQLLSINGVMQFSADGDFQPALTLPQIVKLLDDCLPCGFALDDLQLSTLAEQHPNQDFLTNNPDGMVPPEKVDEVALADMRSRPGMYKTN